MRGRMTINALNLELGCVSENARIDHPTSTVIAYLVHTNGELFGNSAGQRQ